MARRGISRKIATPDQNLRDALEQLAADHDVFSSTVVALIGAASIPPGASMVSYAGAPGVTLTLPPANALGASTGAVVLLLNRSSGSITVVPSRGDTLNGTTSLSLAATKLALLGSDGNNGWLANT